MRNGSALLDVVGGFLVVGVGLVPALTLVSSNVASVRPRAIHAMVAALAADVLDRLAASGPSTSPLPAGEVLSGDSLRAVVVDIMGAVPDALEKDISSGALLLSIERRELSGAEGEPQPASERLVGWIVTVRFRDRTSNGRSRQFFRISRRSGVSR